MASDMDDEYEQIVREVRKFAEEEEAAKQLAQKEKDISGIQQNIEKKTVNSKKKEDLNGTKKNKNILTIMKNKKVIIGICVAVLIVIAASVGYTFGYSGIHKGISCEGVSLSGMTITEAKKALSAKSDSILAGKTIELSIHNKTYAINVPTVTDGVDSDQSAQNAYNYTHKGTFFTRIGHTISALFGGADVPMAVTVDDEKVQKRFEEIAGEALTEAQAPTYEVQRDQLLVTMGKDGVSFDQKETLKKVKQQIAVLDFKPIEVDTITDKAPELDLEQMKKDVDCDPQNATVNTSDGSIVSEKDGVVVDLEKAKEIIGDGTEKTYTVPVTLTSAEITADDLKKVLFANTLGTATTHLNSSQKERTNNVRLAAQFINGTILNAGEEFSYNGTVGSRTEERGFKIAKIFQDGDVIDGLGGGICQTSSTLYMSVLRADLKVTERRNHTFVVSYTPMGQDATVSYGSQDFKFINNTNYPIKIIASQSGNSVTVTLKGTKTTNKTVKLSYVVNSTTPMKTVEKTDSSLSTGQTRTEGGYTGYKVTVYKTVTENGTTKKSVANTSTYSEKDRIVYKAPDTTTTTTTDNKNKEDSTQTVSGNNTDNSDGNQSSTGNVTDPET